MKSINNYLIIFLFLTSCQLESSKKITEYVEEKKNEIKVNIIEKKEEIKKNISEKKLKQKIIKFFI